MATLPTLTVTDDQTTRILDAFKAHFGTTTTAETVKAYKKWLASEVRSVVLAHESVKIDSAARVAKDVKMAEISATLPSPDDVV